MQYISKTKRTEKKTISLSIMTHFWGCLESQFTIVALSRYDKFWAKGNEETPNMLLSILVSFYRAIRSHSALKLEKLCNNQCVFE